MLELSSSVQSLALTSSQNAPAPGPFGLGTERGLCDAGQAVPAGSAARAKGTACPQMAVAPLAGSGRAAAAAAWVATLRTRQAGRRAQTAAGPASLWQLSFHASKRGDS